MASGLDASSVVRISLGALRSHVGRAGHPAAGRRARPIAVTNRGPVGGRRRTDVLGRILIVDDDPAILEVLSEYFSRTPFDVMTVQQGADALMIANGDEDVARDTLTMGRLRLRCQAVRLRRPQPHRGGRGGGRRGPRVVVVRSQSRRAPGAHAHAGGDCRHRSERRVAAAAGGELARDRARPMRGRWRQAHRMQHASRWGLARSSLPATRCRAHTCRTSPLRAMVSSAPALMSARLRVSSSTSSPSQGAGALRR
jgi:CheY-like chemotaxis protein